MKNILLVAALGLSVGVNAIEVETKKVNLRTSGNLKVVKVEVEEACAQMVDPAWDHEEDTRTTRLIMSSQSYFSTKDQIEKLRGEGFTLYGYENDEECTIKNYQFVSTYPEFKNPNPSDTIGEDYFYYGIRNSTLARYAAEQGAFKKATRIYVQGIKELREKVSQALAAKIAKALK